MQGSLWFGVPKAGTGVRMEFYNFEVDEWIYEASFGVEDAVE